MSKCTIAFASFKPSARARRAVLFTAASLGALAALTGAARAEEADEPGSTGGDIIVTANRRAADVSTIPYNITAVGAEQLKSTGVTDVQSLSRQIPNLNVASNGNRNLVAQVPIIRGLNASGTLRPSALGQSPVSVYLGNVEGGNLFPLDDVQRVEVLRGPQGTLFGGGSLGGTLRFIPNAPKLGTFEGSVTGSAGIVAHSSDVDRSLGGTINIPLGETLALRASAKYQHDAGFIDKILDVKQEGSALSAARLADPSDYANSSSQYYTNKDYNWSKTISTRAALRWEPTSDFDATLSFNYAHMEGMGAPTDKSGYPGGTWIFDENVEIPALGDYQDFSPGAEPWKRNSYMGALDMSYDMGFATLSSTTSYLDTSARTITQGALGIATLPYYFTAYYAGDPIYPRFLDVSVYENSEKTFVQELRLVSPGNQLFDYTLGLYYQHQKTTDIWDIYAPGLNEWSDANGYTYTTPYGTQVPLAVDENGRTLSNNGWNTFQQVAAYGELTFNPSDTLHVTGGARVFHQQFKRDLLDNLYGYDLVVESSYKTKTTRAIFKGNVSWDFAPESMFYATFSQGFRRGGVNTFPTEGSLAEPEALIQYKPDTVNNYEIGVKGRIGSWRYSADVFDVEWKNVQIDTATPAMQWGVVVNGKKARSRGVELEAGGPLLSGLDLQLGYAYADAKLTQDFCLPSNDGYGTVDSCGLYGTKGQRLPGSPRHSASATLVFNQPVGDTSTIGGSLNVNYKGSVLSALQNASLITRTLPDYFLVNANLSYTEGPITIGLYARNLFDKRAVLGFSQRLTSDGDTINTTNSVTTPRQIGITLTSNF